MSAFCDNYNNFRAMANITDIAGGITAAAGFRAAGVVAGIKKSGRKDFALVAADVPAVAAAVFTTNKVAAAPSTEPERGGGVVAAVALNSGCANAAPGQGLADTREMAGATAAALGLDESAVLVCSIGGSANCCRWSELKTARLAAAALS